jgi:fused signal recognition particle receptor
MDNQLAVIVKESGLEQSKANFILEKFQDYFKIAGDWEQKAKMLVVTDEAQVAEMKMAREGRLFLREKRIAIEKSRKELKEQSLREGKAIDGIANVLKSLIEPIEDYLESQEKYAEIKEQERKDLERIELEKKAAEEARIAAEKEEAERVAKEKAEAEERKRLQEENARLQEEAEAKEKARQEELAKIEVARKEELAREREKQEAVLQKQREEAEAKALQDRKEAEKVEAELRAKIAEREAADTYTASEVRQSITEWYDPKDIDEFMENGLKHLAD